MSFIWLIVWLCAGLPSLPMNGWQIALLVCLAFDAYGGPNQSA